MELGLALFLISFIASKTALSQEYEIEEEVLEQIYLNSKFQTFVRPTVWKNKSREPLVVAVNLHILSFDLDVKNQAFDMSMYFRQEWEDDRLMFGTRGLLPEVILHDTIGFWTPDLFFVEEVEGQIQGIIKPNVVARITVSGNVLLSQRLSLKASCPMNFRRYPLDTQTCTLRIESYGYTAKDLILVWDSKGESPAVEGTPNNPDYDVTYTFKDYMVNSGKKNFTTLELEFRIERHFAEHFFHIYIPVSFFIFVSWIPFWLSPSSHLIRFTISLTSIFSTLLHLSTNANLFVSAGYLTALDAWVFAAYALLFAAFLETVFVAYLSNDSNLTESSETMKGHSKFLSLLPATLPLRMDFFARVLCPVVFVLNHLIVFFM